MAEAGFQEKSCDYPNPPDKRETGTLPLRPYRHDNTHSLKTCFEHVLSGAPEYLGGSEAFIKQLALLEKMEGDHSVCSDVPVENGRIQLSTGEVVKIIRLKSDFRCPCRSVWYPYYMLNAGGQSITVQHPNTPKNCEEVCL